jgi:hypothetical protein
MLRFLGKLTAGARWQGDSSLKAKVEYKNGKPKGTLTYEKKIGLWK